MYEGINPAFELRLGVTSEDIREMDVSNCLGSDDARAVSEALRACLAEGTEVRIGHSLSFGGERQNMETTVVPIMDAVADGAVRLIGSHRILDKGPFHNGAERSLAQASVNLLSIQEEIQQRIASDLHDSTCQHLIAASLGLMRIRQTMGDQVGAARLCDEIDASIDEALREIRAFAYLLHPQNLTDDGLKDTIEHYADGFAARTSLRVTTRIVSGVDRLPYEKQRSLLRVVQEALTNVFRHARATEVSIVIQRAGGHFRLTVSDNGRGLQAGRTNQAISAGVGIPAMRARLEQIGGSLEIRSDPAAHRSGTVLCAVFPHALVGNSRNRRKDATVVRAPAGTH
ncbi:histidine kinase [Bradyrhizobium yuanmingense]|uniref:sensor histidine kinase n=1 Tax=Bradyrhizobium yuanmingense TaxID=108015 RepID=UPI0023B8A29B|nr:ATP-binding protein [Bradyrhizobium yuanmingense]MDF0519377.1 histidine kinase [Bradyrhizobium yuanmingense]